MVTNETVVTAAKLTASYVENLSDTTSVTQVSHGLSIRISIL